MLHMDLDARCANSSCGIRRGDVKNPKDWTRGLCRRCYNHHKYADTLAECGAPPAQGGGKKRIDPDAKCVNPECGVRRGDLKNPRKWSRGLCQRCYHFNLSNGNLENIALPSTQDCRKPVDLDACCVNPTCGVRRGGSRDPSMWIRGLCRDCYFRNLNRGTLDRVALPPKFNVAKRPIGYRRPTTDGYVQVRTEGGWRLEHQFVMEETLGRYLIKGETVHHKNRKRDDNRPENLELWYNQPYGARVTDLIDYLVVNQREAIERALGRNLSLTVRHTERGLQ
jgi:hypothetical protein